MQILDQYGKSFKMPDTDEIKTASYNTSSFIDSISVSNMLSSLEMPVRSRSEIYGQYHYMINDPIIYTALKLHVTSALGGHETSGEVVFLDKNPDVSKEEERIIDEINESLTPILNDIAYQLCFNAVGYGDSYARIYSEKGRGVVWLDSSDYYLPPLIQPYEKGSKTVGYELNQDRETNILTPLQMARMKMPRMSFLPQVRTQHNHWALNSIEDDINRLTPLPSTIGGSFCEAAEKPFFLLQTALTGLSSARILDSVRESIVGLNVADMTEEQRNHFIASTAKMFRDSKAKTQRALETKSPILEQIFHIIPTWHDKQMYSIDAGGSKNSAGANGYNIDDVMFYAKLLAGSLGIDISMLGFADQLSGGLGDGGFTRVSAQIGVASRTIRQGLTGFINDVIDVHMHQRYGGVFDTRPYTVNFFGATSALERENQETRERKVNASMAIVQLIQQLRDMNADDVIAKHFMVDQLGLDENDADIYSKLVKGGRNGFEDGYN